MLSALYRVVSVIIFNINITHFLIDNVAVICLQQTCALNNFRNSRYVEKKNAKITGPGLNVIKHLQV